MRTLTIDRRKWLRGGRDGNGALSISYLLDPVTGHMCCLGFAALNVVGLADSAISGMCMPPIHTISDWIAAGFGPATTLEYGVDILQFISTNDDSTIHDDVREERLQKLFADIGVYVTFVN